MYLYNDICDDGTEVSSGPGYVLFVGVSLVAVPSQLMYIRAEHTDGAYVAIGKAHDTDETIIVNSLGIVRTLGHNHGNHAHGLFHIPAHNAIGAVWVESGAQWAQVYVNTLTLEGDAIGYSPMPDTYSTGFLDFSVIDSEPWWTATHSPIQLAGQTFHHPLRRGEWTVGVHPDNFVLAYNHAEGKLYLAWEGNTQAPAHINYMGEVAVSAEPDRPLFRTPDTFTPWVEPQVPVEVKPYTQPKAVGLFWGSSERYGYYLFPGNCEVLFGPDGQFPASDWLKMKTPRPVIAGLGALNVPADKLLGYWAPTGSSSLKTVFRYWDSRVYFDDPTLTQYDVRLFQAYPNPGEDPGAFANAIHDQLDLYGGMKMIVAAFYTRLGTIDPVKYCPAYDNLLRRDDVMGMLAFDGARSGAMFDIPLSSWYNAFYQASPGLPSFAAPPQELPVAFKTAVSHLISAFPHEDFDNKIETRPANAQGTWETVEVIKNTDNTYSIKNNTGTEWMSIQRDGSIQSRPTSGSPGAWEKFDKSGNTLIERNKDSFGGFIPSTRRPVTFLVAGSL